MTSQDQQYFRLTAISPLDGRYGNQVQELGIFLSEFALIKYRIKIEVEYLIALSLEKKFTALKPLSTAQQTRLHNLYRNFKPKDACRVKVLEKETSHDVKAVEYYLREKLDNQKLGRLNPWLHFALTSEDVNNLSYTLMYSDALKYVLVPALKKLYRSLRTLARRNKDFPLLSLTHGQPATPTTLGKEIAVFAARLEGQINYLNQHVLSGKLAGASGTWGAHAISCPKVNWPAFSRRFVKNLGLEPNLINTQIEAHDTLAESYHCLVRINSILLDFCRDIWAYISRGIFRQKAVAGEVGSSTMPHKINPIKFENAEGNLGIASTTLNHLAQKLTVSRLQRDLSDSTTIRNQAVPVAHLLLAIKNIQSGLDRLAPSRDVALAELNQHWEVLAEAIQTILRKAGRENAYEKLKEITRGQAITKEDIRAFVSDLDIPEKERLKLLDLTPQTYLGLAPEIVELLK